MDERDRERADEIDRANAARKLTRGEPMEWEKRNEELRQAFMSGAREERSRCVDLARIVARDLPDEPSNGHLSARAAVLGLIDLIEGS